jgi:hypothetical protein
MPKYIKLFETFVTEASPYKFDPTKTSLTGAALYAKGVYVVKFPTGRVFLATEDSESLQKAPGNVTVTLNAVNAAALKSLIALGGSADAKATGEMNEPGGGVYKHANKVYFTLADATSGEQKLSQIAKILGQPAAKSGSTGTSGTAGTAGKAGNYADSFFGKDIMDKFRSHVSSVTGTAYVAATSIPAYQAAIQNKEVNAKLTKDPEFAKLTQQAADQAKLTGVVDMATGKDKKGKVDQVYMDIRKKLEDRINVVKAQ